MVCIDMLIMEYKDCFGLLGGLEALEKFRAMRGLAFTLWLQPRPRVPYCGIPGIRRI